MYNCFRTQPRKALMNNLRGLKIFLVLSLSVHLYGNTIKIIGTYDLNKNNLNEILILKDGGIQYVELDENSIHQELWYYHPNGIRSASIVDAVLANINEDPNPEIIAIVSSPSIISDKKVPSVSYTHLTLPTILLV